MNSWTDIRGWLGILLTLLITSFSHASGFRNSLSVSPFTDIQFSQGYIFKDANGFVASNTEALQRLFVRHGATEVYARIATNRYTYNIGGADHSLETAKKRARLAKKLGLPFNPELGVFDHYGDVLGQPIPDFSQYPEIYVPGPWETLTLNQMKLVLIQYGALVAREIKSTGATVNFWDIGNEINFGFAGVALGHAPNNVDPAIGQQPDLFSVLAMPDGGLSWLQTHLWNYEAQLMRAVQVGILSVYPQAKFSTHIALIPFSTIYTNAFYATLLQHGARLDMVGYSLYPSNYPDPADRMAGVKSVITDTLSSFGLKSFIAEGAYPSQTITTGPFASWNFETPGYPLSSAGQAALLRDLTAWGKTRGLAGIRPWAPDYVADHWRPLSLFELAGLVATAKPSIDAIKQGLQP